MRSTKGFGLGSLTALAIAVSPVTFAQQTQSGGYALEEVTVTAQRRSESAVDVPISITALSADQLGKGDVQQLGDIMKLTPGLRYDDLGANAQPTIRGVGTSVVVAGASSNVAVYTDGFYSPSMLMADSELLNVESVQVLKGPQGTLFGRNTTGGAILVTSKDPQSEAQGRFEASYGSYNAQRYQVYATGGPTEDLAFDVSALVRTGDGYIDNITTGSDSDGEYENWAIRLGAKWNVTDSTSVLLRYSHSDTDDPSPVATGLYEENGMPVSTAAVYGSNVATKPHEVSYGYKSQYESDADVIQLTVRSELSFADFTSYTQYRDESGTHYYDFDGSALPIYHYNFETTDKVFSQEFLLASNGDGRLQWTTGLFYFTDETEYPHNEASVGGSPFVPTGGSGVKSSSMAIFGDATYALLDNLFLTIGARYSVDEVKDAYFIYDNTGEKYVLDDADDDSVTPRVALRYEIDDNSSVYVSYTEGFKAGIINVAGGTSALNNGDINSVYVDPEEIKAWEVGYKYSGGNLVFDAAVFSYDYEGLQVASYAQTDSIIRNAASSSVFGVETQVRYAFTEQLHVNLGVAYLDAEYDEFEESQTWDQCLDAVSCGSFLGVFLPSYGDASGKEMQRAPELTATLGVSYEAPVQDGLLVLSGNLYHTSSFYFDSSELFEQDSYQLLSMRAEWTDPSETYSVALYGDNLTDEEYYSQVLPQFYGPLVTWGAPRTVGVSLAVNF
ncbi:TonB-dependent receptor [Pseudomaricurvus sp. HS19]|uniref:TonB-dependent receptor n=1 Tax=Pseudomaricurvus sp. HS19 TaxID=2692626 RepID=UPI00136FC066|nr:TonB-dependent receptor [Pseudomaricurvus sp. HS19]MYM63300.1 TonB-dependent receptor [Pseudomaricurvus sp. HS19]